MILLALACCSLLLAMLYIQFDKSASRFEIAVREEIKLELKEMTEDREHALNAAANSSTGQAETMIAQEGPMISVRLSETKELERVPIEQYVLGVALAELPGNFETEAIKAQMLAIRTYIVHRLMKELEVNGTLHTFEITDTTTDQVYMPLHQVEQYKAAYPDYYQAFVEALQETQHLIISYDDQPIDAVFFSTSNGYTQAAKQLWGQEIAYLQRVASPWDALYSPNYETETTLTFSDIYEKLNLKQSRRNERLSITNVKKNDSGRIQSLEVNGASFTGRELRERLGLASTAMTWSIDSRSQTITIICYGYGHGIGLSQWGAYGMAKEGYSAEAIIKHYYSGVDIEKATFDF